MALRSAPDKVVEFFPTYGYRERSSREWVLPIHGWIYEPDRISRMRRASLAIFRRYLRFKTRQALTPLFLDRARAFFAGNERGQQVMVRIGEHVFPLGESGPNGHFRGVVRLPDAQVGELLESPEVQNGWLSFSSVNLDIEETEFTGRVQLIPEAGLSVISDIDDTIKHSQVHDRGELLANTFLRDFQAVPSAADVYKAWSALGACFHYVSASPWQLFGPLAEFFRQEGFPDGTFHLRLWRLRDSRLFRRANGRPKSKLEAIDAILRTFPQRRFVLIGDSGEQDPELYGTVARMHPSKVQLILIRDVSGHDRESPRFLRAFEGVNPAQWALFEDAETLRDRLISDPEAAPPPLPGPLT